MNTCWLALPGPPRRVIGKSHQILTRPNRSFEWPTGHVQGAMGSHEMLIGDHSLLTTAWYAKQGIGAAVLRAGSVAASAGRLGESSSRRLSVTAFGLWAAQGPD